MNQLKESRVFVLGAGCSAQYGYPLGDTLADQLQEFRRDIPDDCALIRQSVSNTVTLMERHPTIETLDQLAKQIEDDFLAWRSQRGIVFGQLDGEKERLAAKQILDAKVATSAMFVAGEGHAREKGLAGYKRLLESVFGGEPWDEAVAKSDCHVLSFNYDRLFEIAFLDYFRGFPRQERSVYEKTALNAGFNSDALGNCEYRKVQPAAGRFCFLKLHGSASWWAKGRKGNKPDIVAYKLGNPEPAVNLRDFEEFLRSQWEPLIAFAHEKQRAVRDGTDFLPDRYLEKIEDHAVSVFAAATEVRIIGYSIAPINSRHVVDNLLSRVPEGARIVVQNPDTATVRSRLEAYPSLKGRVEFDPTPF